MKLTINTPTPVVQPPKTITLELSEREFAILRAVAGHTLGVDAARLFGELWVSHTAVKHIR